MRVDALHLERLRSIRTLDLPLAGRSAWITGANGAGKTSLLEALCLLGYGRSFRGRAAEGLIQRGETSLEVVCEWRDASGARHVSGLRHHGESWEARRDGQAVSTLGGLAQSFPVLCFHPGSAPLAQGPAEERRRALDWVVFHVEPDFADLTRRYSRALRQRNALLRAMASDPELEPWEREMGRTAEAITHHRRSVLGLLAPALSEVWPHLSDTPAPGLGLRPGWRAEDSTLDDLLLLNRPRDRELGYTTVGPHRADLALGEAFGVSSEQWSRGQAKLIALALTLAQSEALRRWRSVASLLLFDDLAAELDVAHQARVLRWVAAADQQALVTGTVRPPSAGEPCADWAVFHVEHGVLAPA